MAVIGSLSPSLPISLPSRSLLNRPFSDPNFTPIISKPTLKSPRSSHRRHHNHRTVLVRTNSGSRDPKETGYLDENGVVDDMDGYLNYLSLEYDSVWDTKPSWCQPWTIALTGVAVVGCSWIVFNSAVITTGASLLIAAWWYIFLYSYPKEYSNMIAERRKKVTNGVEDTFGMRSQ